MVPCYTKQQLYEVADHIQAELPKGSADTLSERIAALPSIVVQYLPFRTPGLRGMASIDPENQQDIILLSQHLQVQEKGFYGAHELMHLRCHRSAGVSAFTCRDPRYPAQLPYLEWQANEGAAQITMPWKAVLQEITRCTLKQRSDILRLRLHLAQHFCVTEAMVKVRLESLRYEIQQLLQGKVLEQITLLSAAQQLRMGIDAVSLNTIADQLFQQELNRHKRYYAIDIFHDGMP